VALMAWYTHVRRQMVSDRFPQELYDGLVDTLHLVVVERINHFTAFCEKLKASKTRYQQQTGDRAAASLIRQKEELYNNRNQAGDLICNYLDRIGENRESAFSAVIDKHIHQSGPKYITIIKSLKAEESRIGTAWLQRIVDDITAQILALFPAIA
jgi:hypothetical protein